MEGSKSDISVEMNVSRLEGSRSDDLGEDKQDSVFRRSSFYFATHDDFP